MRNYAFYSDLSSEEFLSAVRSSVLNTEYMLADLDGGFSLGVMRGGHSGGYWYDGYFSEEGGKLKISGKIEYKDAYPNTVMRKIGEGLMFVFFFIFFFYILIPLWIVRYIRRKKYNRKEAEEESLERFMFDIMGCRSESGS